MLEQKPVVILNRKGLFVGSYHVQILGPLLKGKALR